MRKLQSCRHVRLPLQFGYTLVEILLVFALTALLLSVALPSYVRTTEAAKLRAREQNLATLRDAIDKFKADIGRLPNELAELVQRRYLRAVPVDPVTGSDRWRTLPSPVAEPGIHDVAAPIGNDPADGEHAEGT